MNNKYINVDLNDARSDLVAEVLGNKTCKRILNLLADFSELSEKDIALKLNIPLNTIEYNLRKLLEAGFIDKSSNFFWSVKGKKIPTYKLANKKIIISTKTRFKSLAFSAVIGGLLFGAFKTFSNYAVMSSPKLISMKGPLDLAYSQVASVETASQILPSLFSQVFLWALLGLLAGIGAYFIFKFLKGGMKR